MMIKVYKTDVANSDIAYLIVQQLLKKYPGFAINFDLMDCDNVLRVEGQSFRMDDIVSFLNKIGYNCEEMRY
ncbi:MULTISPECIES: hypothetical protein [Sphingobacterium]|uniref:hypothetical protein n=1 Tax=Sphingobacterium TaxID=28453 RepID=UPI00191AF8B2|nr:MULTISPECIES: hypothetical protein [Sphingobacterium]QQT25723.1 hypothetical protein I6J02_18705 [Sphingobacterium spiritivorum]